MKVHRLIDEVGNVRGFELENAYIGPKKIASLLGSVAGVTDVESRGLFAGSPDVHVKFLLSGVPCIVLEPFGDNSRFWVGPEAEDTPLDLNPLIHMFELYQPPKLAAIRGDIVTLNFRSLFGINKGGG